MHPDDEMRRHPRVRVAALAAIETMGTLNANNQALGAVRDVSRCGIGLQTGQPPMAGQTVQLRMELGDEIHVLRGRATRVQRCGKGNFFDIGIDWTDCTPEQLAFLDRVLAVLETQPQD